MKKQEIYKPKSELSDICWFCENRPADQSDSAKVKMYRNVTKAKIAPKYTKISWQKLTIDVPRCRECTSFFHKKNIMAFGGAVLSFPAAYLGYLFAASILGWTSEGLHVLGGAIGFSIAIILTIVIGNKFLRQKKSRMVNIDKLKYPLVQEKIKDGWKIGSPSS